MEVTITAMSERLCQTGMTNVEISVNGGSGAYTLDVSFFIINHYY